MKSYLFDIFHLINYEKEHFSIKKKPIKSPLKFHRIYLHGRRP